MTGSDRVVADRWRRLRALMPMGLVMCLALSVLSACAPPVTIDCAVDCPAAAAPDQARQESGPAPTDPARVERLEAALDRQRQQIMRLELRLLARQSEIQALSSAEQEAVQEVVRTKAKLRSMSSKAETVANLAEVKLALQSAQNEVGQGLRMEDVAQAQQYVGMSEQALEEGNVDGAAYLIGQAMSYLRPPETPTGAAATADDELGSFLVPVRMTVKRRANVRSGAGTDSDVLTTLDAGSSVMAVGYAGLWVHIALDDEALGWVHYGLLDMRQ